jgi:excisionase family DNA binding protein
MEGQRTTGGERGGGADGDLSLREAAAALGVHYMTAYRHVRTGRLPARQVRGEWRVRTQDLEQVMRPAAPRPATPGRRQGAAARRRLVDRLLAGDEPGAWGVLEAAVVGGLEPVGVHLELLAPAMADVGDGWASGAVTVDEEHRATAVALRLVGRLGPRFARPGRKRGTVLLAAAPGDHHSLPVAIAADVVRAARFAVVDLGGAVPPESLARSAAGLDQLVAVGICASVSGDAGVGDAVAAVRSAVPGIPVFAGGVGLDAPAAAAAGADGFGADATALVALVDRGE